MLFILLLRVSAALLPRIHILLCPFFIRNTTYFRQTTLFYRQHIVFESRFLIYILCLPIKNESVHTSKKSKSLHKTYFRMKTPILFSCYSMRKINLFKSKVKNTKKITFYILFTYGKNYILISNQTNNHYILCF